MFRHILLAACTLAAASGYASPRVAAPRRSALVRQSAAAPVMSAADDGFVPDMERRVIMNALLVGATAVPGLWLAGGYAYFFAPPGGGGSSGGVTAHDALGDDVTVEKWLATHPAGDRKLVEGLKGDATYLIVTPEKKIETCVAAPRARGPLLPSAAADLCAVHPHVRVLLAVWARARVLFWRASRVIAHTHRSHPLSNPPSLPGPLAMRGTPILSWTFLSLPTAQLRSQRGLHAPRLRRPLERGAAEVHLPVPRLAGARRHTYPVVGLAALARLPCPGNSSPAVRHTQAASPCGPSLPAQYDNTGKVVRGPAPLSLALAHVNTDSGKVVLSTWTETDFRTGLQPWWK